MLKIPLLLLAVLGPSIGAKNEMMNFERCCRHSGNCGGSTGSAWEIIDGVRCEGISGISRPVNSRGRWCKSSTDRSCFDKTAANEGCWRCKLDEGNNQWSNWETFYKTPTNNTITLELPPQSPNMEYSCDFKIGNVTKYYLTSVSIVVLPKKSGNPTIITKIQIPGGIVDNKPLDGTIFFFSNFSGRINFSHPDVAKWGNEFIIICKALPKDSEVVSFEINVSRRTLSSTTSVSSPAMSFISDEIRTSATFNITDEIHTPSAATFPFSESSNNGPVDKKDSFTVVILASIWIAISIMLLFSALLICIKCHKKSVPHKEILPHHCSTPPQFYAPLLTIRGSSESECYSSGSGRSDGWVGKCPTNI